MSHPTTEAGDAVSNNSLFSDSVEFDRAEKPITEVEANQSTDDFNDPNYVNNDNTENRGVTHLYPEDNNEEYDKPAYDDDEPAPADEVDDVQDVEAPFLKERTHKMSEPADWVPVDDVAVLEGDAADEFDINTALKPQRKDSKVPIVFINGKPDTEGNVEVTNCFDEPGLLYRIVSKPNKTWAFYNDSVAFEIQAVCTFGPQSKLEALGSTVVTKNEKGEHVAEVTVYPGETEMFVKGFVNGFTSKLRALPLSDDYFAERSAAQHEGVISKELAAVREAALAADVDLTDTEAVLQVCLDENLLFVDPSFPPVQESIEKGSDKKFKTLPWARPRQYLRDTIHALKKRAKRAGEDEAAFDDQVRLFRRPVVPGSVDGGELGDCWLQCAIATVSENEKAIMNMFRHPKGADAARAERRIGAHRVTFNKNGLWRSVVVDDYVPVVGAKPKFARVKPCGTGDEDFEIWPAILQKAYAKLHGSYAAIMSGDPVHALTDMTGAPSYRFDDAFNESTITGGDELFEKLCNLSAGENKFQVILTTPGKAPALTPGASETQYDFSEEPEIAKALRGTSLLPGHAYTVLQAKNFSRENVKLIQVRNPWPYVMEGEDREEPVEWAEDSDIWSKHNDIARDCGMADGRTTENECERATTRWFAWSDALRFFAGGGVVFQNGTQVVMNELRVPVSFADCRPSLLFEISVSAPTDVVVMLSNMDHRGIGMATNKRINNAEEDDESNLDYPPVMLSLAIQNDKYTNTQSGKANKATGKITDDVFRVVLNTCADVSAPSDSKWTFLQAREIGMQVHLTPEDGPYYLIPRLMEDETTMGSGNSRKPAKPNQFANLEQIHFSNSYARLYPAEAHACAGRKEIPVTVGILYEAEAGSRGEQQPQVPALHVRKIAGSSSVFENFPKFPTEGDVSPNEDEVYFQTKAAQEGYAAEKMSTDVY